MGRLCGLAGLAGLLLVAGCVGRVPDSPAPVDQSAPGRWAALTPLPAPRQEVAVAAWREQVWVIGGFGDNAEPVATVESYDPAHNVWETWPSLPVAVHHAAAAVVDNRLFVVGGFSGGRLRWTAQETVYEFVGARGVWEARAPL